MSKEILVNIVRFIFLVLFQIFILNNIVFLGYVNPYLYILFILLLPFDTPKWLLLISAFILGLVIDIFMHTMGMNIAATLLVAWVRPGLIRALSAGKEIEPGMKPGVRDFGFGWFFWYALVLTFLHHLSLFYLEIFKFTHFFQTLIKVLISTAFTVIIIILSQYLFYWKKK